MRRTVLVALLVLVLAGAWFAAALYLPYQGFPPGGVFVSVPHGASRRTVARLLAENGVVRSRIAFELLCRRHPRRTLQAGEYFFDHPVTAFQVFDTLAAGRIYEKAVTIPEGFTSFDIADLLEREGFLSRKAFLEAAGDPTAIRDLAPEARSLEGFLFPATYRFPRRPAPQDVVNAMVRRFRDTWQALAASIPELSSLSVGKVVTLASLVERETPLADERPIIAGVLMNRLRLRRPLQCDPTVVYALELAGRYNGSLGSRSLRFRSPYNTYLHLGLPPGPIANPGEASLRAALDPPRVAYLYFVANTQGGHFFSKTIQEHNRNVARYRRLLAQNNGARTNGSKPAEDPARRVTSKRSP
jgi:UPF0755 protein